ncbi:hypothetical protein [Paraburkholderia dinghuensis]|nr:hypothetical protein [Paraburkholderia dinghuensis]
MKAVLSRDFLALILSVAVVGLGSGAKLPLTLRWERIRGAARTRVQI